MKKKKGKQSDSVVYLKSYDFSHINKKTFRRIFRLATRRKKTHLARFVLFFFGGVELLCANLETAF